MLRLPRGSVIALVAIAVGAVVISAVVHTAVVKSAEDDALQDFQTAFTVDAEASFARMFTDVVAALNGVADAVSALDGHPSHAAFQRVRAPV
jgi:hypothetical protein